MINSGKLDDYMLGLGFTDSLLGSHYLRRAILAYRPGSSLCNEIYPGIAAAVNSTPSRVERAMRHAKEQAWSRGSIDMQKQLFGFSVNPRTGVPTNGELVARLARVCNED